MTSPKDPHRGSSPVTSKQWWSEVKNDPDRFNDWLVKQYRGEVTAALRIDRFASSMAPDPRSKKVLEVIADQERTHADWVLQLLKARGVVPSLKDAEVRYWKEVLPTDEGTFEEIAAIGAHAEAMRLERIMVIADDAEAPADVREVFQKILKDELFHERSFRGMAGVYAMAATAGKHALGRQVLGLEP